MTLLGISYSLFCALCCVFMRICRYFASTASMCAPAITCKHVPAFRTSGCSLSASLSSNPAFPLLHYRRLSLIMAMLGSIVTCADMQLFLNVAVAANPSHACSRAFFKITSASTTGYPLVPPDAVHHVCSTECFMGLLWVKLQFMGLFGPSRD